MKKTIALAEELGLARYQKLDGSANNINSHKEEPGQENLQYVLVLDFEATCWEERTSPPPEIIEFPVVLLSLRTGEILSEFHHYCLPIEYPRLSPFCKNLTGITQAQVDDGLPLGTCLTLFRRWLTEIREDHQITLHGDETGSNTPNATFLTWTDWDLSVCLEYECKRKQLRKPECLNTWIDIKTVYKAFFNRKSIGLSGAMKELGLVFEGREHSGIEDARNTARLVWRMVEAGCPLTITTRMDERSRPMALTAHRKYDEEEEDGVSSRRSKWKHFKPAENPRMLTGVRIGPPAGLLG